MIKNTEKCTCSISREQLNESIKAQVCLCRLIGATSATVSIPLKSSSYTDEQILEILSDNLGYTPNIKSIIKQSNNISESDFGVVQYTTLIITFQLER